jgi:hypothetical protein
MIADRLKYDAANWFWFVAGDETRAYSSAAVGYVPLMDPAYQAFLAANGLTTRIGSEAELWDVLASRGFAVPAGDPVAQAAVRDRDYVALPRAAAIILMRHENMLRQLTRTVRTNAALNTAATTNGLPTTAQAQDLTMPQFVAAVKQLL